MWANVTIVPRIVALVFVACRAVTPHLVRPSLEAYGFDVALITQELFGIKLRWGKDGLLPEYLVIVCALFYNAPEK